MRSTGTIDKRIAVLGAGIQGTCAALALARRGCRIDLFDQAPEAVGQASLWNEGKIHLGFIYAKDASNRTTDMMLHGALHFDGALQRLTGRVRPAGLVSSPFRYVVHRTSQISVDAVAAHLDAVAERYRAVRAASGLRYFDHKSDFVWERMPDREWRAEYDDRETLAAFRTIELSVDPIIVAGMLRAAIAEQTRIRFLPNNRVESVRIDPSDAPQIVIAGEGSLGPYDHVVNALWNDRLRIDAEVGLRPTRPWLHRYKLAVHVAGADGRTLPSTTILLGEYGDIVDFGGRRYYFSWYPDCKLGAWRDTAPPDFAPTVTDDIRRRAFDATMAALSGIVPSVGSLDLTTAKVDVEGGYIFAWGSTDIADPQSGLHCRSDIGVHSHGRYHSINTGKYGMAPYFAEQIADRICGAADRQCHQIQQSAEAR
jgi:glycine/D-amino acid oxidase-like deaminating enzyme